MTASPRFVRRLALLPFLLLMPGMASGQAEAPPPSPAQVLGWELGERFSDSDAVRRYVERLAEASPLVSVEEYGTSWEGRPLLQVVVASETHLARLPAILDANRELTDPDTPVERAREIARTNPAVVYFSYGVHGNESSSSEAAMWTLWDLARGAPEVHGVLDSVVVVVDPVLNPDGRDRYVDFYRGARGMQPDPDPEAREHREPWPGGRANHYLFDLNRDWAWSTQRETRARLATWSRWSPQVHVDFHEMSWRSTYFFFPATPPFNPVYPEYTHRWARRIGEGNAAAFDQAGWLYYTEENFDLFYPGYGDSWPSLVGAIGMTYEQAGGGFAGLAVERPDGRVLTLRDRATRHRTSGNVTLRTVAEGKSDLLLGFADFHRSVDEGLPDILLVPEGEGPASGRFLALLRLLADQGIRIEVAPRPVEVAATPHPGWERRRTFPAGTVRVPARQPRGRLALTLLQAETPLDATYSYDISAWSLPYGFGVEAHRTDGGGQAEWTPVEEYTAFPVEGGAGTVGAVLPPGFRSSAALSAFLAAGGRAIVVPDTFRLGGGLHPRGSIFLPRALNDDLETRMRDADLTVLAQPVSTALTAGGPDLGSERGRVVTLPRIALVGGPGTSSTSFGAHWYFLEHRLRTSFDAIDAEDVAGLDLDVYDVVIVPDGRGLTDAMGEDGVDALVEWTRDGGTLVAVAGGATALAGEVDVEVRRPPEGTDEGEASGEEEGDGPDALDEALMTREERRLERWERSTPGTVLRVTLDEGHPLAAGASAEGLPGSAFVLSTGTVFEPSEAIESVAYFPAGAGEVSGVISDVTLERLERGAWLVQRSVGSGKAILFADDPLFRVMWYGAFPFYANAVLLSHTP